MGRRRNYYDPATNPYPRAVVKSTDSAKVAKETRQQRRKRIREQLERSRREGKR